jgi:hypothetical protein
MIPVFLDSARKHKNLARTYKNWLPDDHVSDQKGRQLCQKYGIEADEISQNYAHVYGYNSHLKINFWANSSFWAIAQISGIPRWAI